MLWCWDVRLIVLDAEKFAKPCQMTDSGSKILVSCRHAAVHIRSSVSLVLATG